MKKYAKTYKIISVILSTLLTICLAISLFGATIISGAKVYLISDKFDAQIESMDLSTLTFIYNGEKITLEKFVKDYVSGHIKDYVDNGPLSGITSLLNPFAGQITDFAVDQALSSDYVNKVVKTQVHSIVDYFIYGDVDEAKARIEKGITLETNPELNHDNVTDVNEKINIEVKKAVFQYIEAESGMTCDQIIILMSIESVNTLMTICRVLTLLLMVINIPYLWNSLIYYGIFANIYSVMLYVVVHNFNEKYKEMGDLVAYQFLKPIVDGYIPYGEKATLYGTICIVVAIVIIVVANIIKKKKSQG